MITTQQLAGMIDHTLLKPEAAAEDIRRMCTEAVQYGFAAVCVNPYRLPLAAELLSGSPVAACSVVGFPLGAVDSVQKVFETRQAVRAGAAEVDMVLNGGAVKDGNWQAVREDITAVVEAAEGALVKVILETCLLREDEKRTACEACAAAGAHFVKTSTGFAGGGATVEDIRLMRSVVGDTLGVKASGGIRNRQDAEAMIEAGANRIGTSAGIEIVKE